MATSFSGGRSRREPPTMDKQLVNYHLRLRVECTLFCNLQSRARTHAVLVIGLYAASSTTKTGRHDIAEILLKVALNTKNQIKS
jgi:hypothetical protein